MTVLVVLEAMAIAFLGVLVAGLLRSHAEILRALHDLGAGIGDPAAPDGGLPRPPQAASLHGPAADLVGESPSGEALALAVTGRRQPTLIAFLSSTCLTCRDFWTAFAQPDVVAPGGARVVIATKGVEAESPSSVRALAPAAVPTVLSSAAWSDYHVPGAPYFVLVDGQAGTVIGEGTGSTWDQVKSLLGQALADSAERPGGRARIDGDLKAAGIGPGHPTLYPDQTETR